MTFYNAGKNAIEILPKVSLIIAGMGAVLMTVFVVAEIIARNFFGYGIPFAVEYAEYLVVVVGVGGAAYTLSKGGHVKADIILNRFPNKPRQWLILIGFIIGLIFLTVITIKAFTLALNSIRVGTIAMYATQTPVGYPQLIMGISLALFTLQLLVEIGRKVRFIKNLY